MKELGWMKQEVNPRRASCFAARCQRALLPSPSAHPARVLGADHHRHITPRSLLPLAVPTRTYAKCLALQRSQGTSENELLCYYTKSILYDSDHAVILS